ncbi:HVO_A0556 family zinc finger protein [Haloferax elongans]|nr:HVO_A0556 family zinc finger protein [Haloferax elongans]
MSQSMHLLDSFDDDVCTYCEGDLVTGSYKDNDAVVCADCGTPAVQLW